MTYFKCCFWSKSRGLFWGCTIRNHATMRHCFSLDLQWYNMGWGLDNSCNMNSAKPKGILVMMYIGYILWVLFQASPVCNAPCHLWLRLQKLGRANLLGSICVYFGSSLGSIISQTDFHLHYFSIRLALYLQAIKAIM